MDAIVENNQSTPSDEKETISIRSQLERDQVLIKFTDSGCGMTEEVRSRVFDPFFTTKDVGKGTGQGLSLCHQIIAQKHDGTMHVDSDPGEGTTFRVGLPIEPTKANDEANG